MTESSDMTAVCVHLSGRIVVSALLELAGERFRSREGREEWVVRVNYFESGVDSLQDIFSIYAR